MNMAEAKHVLMKLADGKYHSMEYTVDDHGNGKVSQRCKVYVAEHGHFEAAHWDVALQELKNAVSGRPVLSEVLPVSEPRKGGAA